MTGEVERAATHTSARHRFRLILFYGARVVRYGLVLTLLATVGAQAISTGGSPAEAAERSVEGRGTAERAEGALPLASERGLSHALRVLLVFAGVALATVGHWVGVGLHAFFHAAERPFYENAGLTIAARALLAWPLSIAVGGLLLATGLGIGG
ncbi:MAG: hypothetical protein ACOC8L_08350 [Spirochaetota bacterium]